MTELFSVIQTHNCYSDYVVNAL